MVKTPDRPKTWFGVNSGGRRVGEWNPNSRISDHDVDLLLELHEQGWGCRRLAAKFEISRSHTKRLCRGEQRVQHVARFKKGKG